MRVVVIIPTYNEVRTIGQIVAETLDLALRPDVLVVDDNSPDGTGAAVERMAAMDSRVSVLHRPGKMGLGTAYTAGFRRALAGPYDVIVEMDGDGSHDPAYVPALVEALAGYDVAIGSRYVPGGGVVEWGFARRLLSWGGNLLARRALALPVADCTSGLRAYRRAVLDAVDLDAIGLEGYAFQVAMVNAAVHRGFRVLEIPIVFARRQAGRSKMSATIVIEAVLYVARARLGRGAPRTG